jgi:hypothetical protein
MEDKKTMRDYQCLMITTKDRRQFFTHEKNYVQLLEFSKLFKAEISVVNVQQAEVLDLAQLAPAFCDANYTPEKRPKFEVLEVKVAHRKHRNRQDILRMAQSIRASILRAFRRGEVVSLQKLRKKYAKHDLTLACLCNHVTQARKELEQMGYQVVKVGGGKYQMSGRVDPGRSS